MAKAAAIAGTFVKMEPVATRKVVRLHVECPIEQADEILRVLGGYPDPANAKWVGLALMSTKSESTLKGGRLAQKAAILCETAAFRQFAAMRGEYGTEMLDANEAADFIRTFCGVESRAHLDHSPEAARLLRDLEIEYQNWLRDAAA